MELWESVRAVPQTALKPITGGRLNGKSDINPMWRIKTLTEQFGVCGVGWKYAIREKRLEKSEKETAAFVDIDLYIKINGEWSEPIPGTGGSMFVEMEKNGLHVSDECFKMALTDAISVSCKALGIGADVYWEKDKTKYDKPQDKSAANTSGGYQPTKNNTSTPPNATTSVQPPQTADNALLTDKQVKDLQDEALARHGKDNFVNCIKELNAALKVDKMRSIKTSDLLYCREFIDSWSDVALPFSVTDD